MNSKLHSDPNDLIRIIRESSRPLDPIPTDLAPTPESLEGIRHLVFDVYGTLMVSGVGDIGNSAPANRGDAIAQTLTEAGARNLPDTPTLEKAYLEEIRTNQAQSKQRGAIHPEVEIREVWQSFIERVIPNFSPSPAQIEEIALRFELSVNPVWPMPGLVETLESLSQEFPKFGIVSNAQFFTPLLFPALTRKSLDELSFDPNGCIWSFEEREAKPSPRLFESLIRRLDHHYSPGEVLYVGNDMLNDIATAAKAGLQTALFAGDQRSLRLRTDHPDCEDVSPNLTIQSLNQLTERLNQTREF